MKATQVLRRLLRPLLIPVLALVTALAVGAIIMWIFGDPPLKAYQGLFNGAFGSPKAWARTIRKMSPFLLTGLSVAVAFKAGLFNIGASGQFVMGTVASVAVGINFDGLPAAIHLPLALLAGIAAGAPGARSPASQGVHGRARSHRHHHAQLYRCQLRRLDGLCRRQPGADARAAVGSDRPRHFGNP